MDEFRILQESMSELNKKVDKLTDICYDINSVTVKQEENIRHNTKSLDYHIKRTDLLEKRVDDAEKYQISIKTTASNIFKGITIISVLLGIVVTIYKLLNP